MEINGDPSMIGDLIGQSAPYKTATNRGRLAVWQRVVYSLRVRSKR